MVNNAFISVKSFNNLDTEEVIEVVTPGKFRVEENGTYKAIYEETEISGMMGTTTTLLIGNDELVLEREGSTNAKMNFKKGETSISIYDTPYGMLDLQIHTDELEVDITENGGKVFAKYSLELGGQTPIVTNLSLDVRIN